MRVDEGRKGWIIFAIKMKATYHGGEGGGRKSLLSDPGSELRLRRVEEKEKVRRSNRWDKLQ